MNGRAFAPIQSPAPTDARPLAHTEAPDPPERDDILLALDAGVRETGWALFRSARPERTGSIRLPRRRSLTAADRVNHLVACLDQLVAHCQPMAVAYGQPSGLRWPMPALELLDTALRDWSAGHRLPLYTYSDQEIRAAIARHSQVPPDQLAYAVMARLGMIGYRKSTQEWEALAVGCYHIARGPGRGAGPPPA